MNSGADRVVTSLLRGQTFARSFRMASEELDLEIQNCNSVQAVVSKFKVEQLKQYLRVRDLNLSGDKQCLAEKVFGACKLYIPRSTTAAQDEENKKQDKEEKLCLENGVIRLPPPRCLKTGWQLNSANFPDTIEDDVVQYLKEKAPKALVKGSSLEESRHVVDAAFHNISPNLKYCFARGKVIPHERTNNDPYEPWVCLKKDDGSVVTAECSCVAG